MLVVIFLPNGLMGVIRPRIEKIIGRRAQS